MPPKESSQPKSAFGQLADFLSGSHKLSKLIPLVLLAADAVLTLAVIWKVPCQFCPSPAPSLHFQAMECGC